MVTTELRPGGAERCLANLALYVQQRGFVPTVYCLFRPPPDDRAELVYQLRSAAIEVVFLGVESAWQFPRGVRQLARELAFRRTQIVQTFLFHANLVGTLAARRAAVPVVITGLRVAEPSRLRARLERWLAARVDYVTCVSEDVASFARERGLSPGKLVVIPNGVRIRDFDAVEPVDPRSIGLGADRSFLVSVGRLHAQKGFDWLIDLAPRLLENLPGHDLLIVGDGPGDQQLRHRARVNGVDRRVHFLGYRNDVRSIIASSDALLLPSRYEGMPNVVLEAMALGKAVVATACHGVSELLGPAGFAVPVEDADAFVVATEKLMADGAGGRVGVNNRRRVVEHFDLDCLLERYVDLYSGLLGDAKSISRKGGN